MVYGGSLKANLSLRFFFVISFFSLLNIFLFQNCSKHFSSFEAFSSGNSDLSSEKVEGQDEIPEVSSEKFVPLTINLQAQRGIIDSDLPYSMKIKISRSDAFIKIPEELTLNLECSLDFGVSWQKIATSGVENFDADFITKEFLWNPNSINSTHFLFKARLLKGKEVIAEATSSAGEFVFRSYFVNKKDLNVFVVDSINGDDNLSGKDLQNSWRTLEHAFSKAPAGSVILLRGRVFPEENLALNFPRSSDGLPTVIRSYALEKPIIQKAFVVNKKTWEVFNEGAVKYFKYTLSPKDDIQKIISASIRMSADEPMRLPRYNCLYDLLSKNEKYSKNYGSENAKCFQQKMSEKNITSLTNEQIQIINSSPSIKIADTYMGPGFYFDKNNKIIYLRLQNSNTLDYLNDLNLANQYSHLFNVFSKEVDPSEAELTFDISDLAFIIGQKEKSEFPTDNLIISGLKIQHYNMAMRVFSAKNLVVSNAQFLANRFGIYLQNSGNIGSRQILIEKSVFNSYYPRYVPWTDVKQDFYLAPFVEKKMDNLKTGAISVDSSERPLNSSKPWLENIVIRQNRILNTFDGVVLGGETRNWSVLNNYFSVMDDSVQMDVRVYNFEFAGNLVHGPGVSHDDSNFRCYDYKVFTEEIPNVCLQFAGKKFIHHNVIDPTFQKIFYGRSYDGAKNNEIIGIVAHQAFPSHLANISASPNISDPWKIYQNTIIFEGRQPGLAGVGRTISIKHEVLNNIIIQRSNDNLIYNADLDRDVYQGNVYIREQVSEKPWFERKNKEPLEVLSLSSEEITISQKVDLDENYILKNKQQIDFSHLKLATIPNHWPGLVVERQSTNRTIAPGVYALPGLPSVLSLKVSCQYNQDFCNYLDQ